jgi:hypothetical protein
VRATRIRHWLMNHLPRPLNIAGPVIQLYVHDQTRTTTFTFANFPSLYAPRRALSYRYVVECRGPDGTALGRRTLKVPAFGVRQVGIDELFGSELPSWGTIHVGLRPTSLLNRSDQHLGRLTPHFYTLYHEREMRFLALVHPQTLAVRGRMALPEWRSNLLLDAELAETLEVFQVNPTGRTVTSELRVHNENGTVLTRSSCALPPYGVRRERWVVQEFGPARWISLGADHLTGPNAKPLVFVTNRDGLLSGSHS